jgi:hypothetical protein
VHTPAPRRLLLPLAFSAALLTGLHPAASDEPKGAAPTAAPAKAPASTPAAKIAAAAPTTTAAVSIPRGAALQEALKTRRVKNVKWTEMSLKDMVTWLRVATGWNFIVNHAELGKANIDVSTLAFDIELADVSIATLLEVTLQPHGMAVRIQDNLVWITSKADSLGKLMTRVYGISHITWQKIDFAAPDINLLPSGYTPPDEYVPETLVEDDPLLTGDAVADLVKEIVAPGEWETEGWAIKATKTYLSIRAPAAVHAKIPRAIAVVASLK